MTTPIDDPMFTLSIPPRFSGGPTVMYIPEDQRRTEDTATKVKLPAGMHTVQMLWQGGISGIDLRFDNGTSIGRTLVRLPVKVDATPVIYSMTIPPGGGYIYFVQTSPVTEEQVSESRDALGVTVYLNEARKPLT